MTDIAAYGFSQAKAHLAAAGRAERRRLRGVALATHFGFVGGDKLKEHLEALKD